MPQEERVRRRAVEPPARTLFGVLLARVIASIPGLVLAAVFGGGCNSTSLPRVAAVGADTGDPPGGRAFRRCEEGDRQTPDALNGVGLSPNLGCRVHRKLIGALDVAAAVLVREPGCRAMFLELGGDGISVLRSSSFSAASAREESGICRHAHAFTAIGADWIRLCRSFAKLSDLEGAAIILHEGLHHAGLGEWPSDPRGARSMEITYRVVRRCGLDPGRYPGPGNLSRGMARELTGAPP